MFQRLNTIGFFLMLALSANGQATEDLRRVTIDNSISGNNAEPILFSDVSLNYYNLISSNLQFSKDNDLQKVVFLPLKLLSGSNYLPQKLQFFENTKLNFAQKNGLSTLGIGIGMDNSYPSSRRGRRLFKETTNGGGVGPTKVGDLEARTAQETDATYAQKVAAHLLALENYKQKKREFDAADSLRYVTFYKKLIENSFKLTVGYNVSLFSVIGGDKVDLNNDNLIDNYYRRAGRDLSLTANYVFTERLAFSATVRQQLGRATAVEKKNEVTYYGGSIGLAGRIFVLNKNYEKTKDYYKSLFVPQIILGGTVEYLKATKNEADAKDGITRAMVLTPFLDFKISLNNQFRIGIPIKHFRSVNNGVEIGPFLQYTLTLAKQE